MFIGPSLPLDEARKILPSATYLPPIAQGDLLSLVSSAPCGRPWAVGIVDGVFYQSLPVWHKEILAALERGVLVFGSSSMGALRAAECARFGMVGIGEIYRLYATGALTDDDEVALVHAGAEASWRSETEALVNVRATCEAAVTAGRMSPRACEIVIGATKSLWFPERTREAILEAAARAGLAATEVSTMRDLFEGAYVDLKRADALALLEAISGNARPGAGSPASSEQAPTTSGRDTGRVVVARSMMFDALAERDHQVESEGFVIRDEEIARYAALTCPDFATMRDRALDRILVEELAQLWQVTATSEEVAAERKRFAVRNRLADAELEQWCRDNDLAPEALERLIVAEARARRLRDWAAMRRGKRLLVGPLLDELRLAGDYERIRDAAAKFEREAPASEEVPAPGGQDLPATDLAMDQLRAGGWRPDVGFERFATEAGFQDASDLVEELARHSRARARRRRAWQVAVSMFGEDGEEP